MGQIPFSPQYPDHLSISRHKGLIADTSRFSCFHSLSTSLNTILILGFTVSIISHFLISISRQEPSTFLTISWKARSPAAVLETLTTGKSEEIIEITFSEKLRLTDHKSGVTPDNSLEANPDIHTITIRQLFTGTGYKSLTANRFKGPTIEPRQEAVPSHKQTGISTY